MQPPRANCSSPWSLICDRLLKTDRASPGLWIPFPRTLTSSLSGGWSLCEMANGARDIIRQTPGLQSQPSPPPPVTPMLHTGTARCSQIRRRFAKHGFGFPCLKCPFLRRCFWTPAKNQKSKKACLRTTFLARRVLAVDCEPCYRDPKNTRLLIAAVQDLRVQ